VDAHARADARLGPRPSGLARQLPLLDRLRK
jgi:hypothetical protein